MGAITLRRTIKAEQWLGPGHAPPEGCIVSRPEVHWSADRKLVYFTYGSHKTAMPRHWLGCEKRPLPVPAEGSGPWANGWVSYQPKDGDCYWREFLAFNFWDVKSEASRTGDHRAVFLDQSDPEQMALWHDYASAEKWDNPIPQCVEYRANDARYGRGYAPIYLYAGDWLLHEPKDGFPVYVVSDEDFKKLAA